MTTFIIALSLFQVIQSGYYSDSYKVAAINPDEIEFKGDSLYFAYNYIARANYKVGNYKKAYSITEDYLNVDISDIGHKPLYYDIVSLRALVHKNMGYLERADSLYQKSIRITPDSLDSVKYRSHLNYAELLRLKMDYRARELNLLTAMGYAPTDRARNKVIRNLARYYFNVKLDFNAAQDILNKHSELKTLTDEGKSGWYLVQAELAEALKKYERAKQFYLKANNIAAEAGFISFQLSAVDGFARSSTMVEEMRDQNQNYYIILTIMAVLSYVFYVINRCYDETYRNRL